MKRIKEIYQQEVIKIETINIKGRRKLSVIKTKITDLSKNKKSKKRTIPEDNEEGNSWLGKILSVPSNEQDFQLIKDKSIELNNQENDGNGSQINVKKL